VPGQYGPVLARVDDLVWVFIIFLAEMFTELGTM